MVTSTQYGDEFPKSRLSPMHPLNTSYCCSDGEWLILTCVEYERFYPKACEVLGLTHMIDDPKFTKLAEIKKNQAPLIEIVTETFLTKDRAYWLEHLQEADIPCEAIRHFKDVHTDPQAWANGDLSKFTFDSGREVAMPSTPIRFGNNDAPPCNCAPGLGEHTEQILSDHGYTPEQVKAFYDAGAVYTKNKSS